MNKKKTIGEIRDHFILQGVASGWSHNTLETDGRILKFLIDSEYGIGADLHPDDLDEERLLYYLIDRKKLGRNGKGMRYSTMNTEFLVLKRFFNWAFKTKLIGERLLTTVTPPRADRQIFAPLTDEEITEIFSAVRHSPQMTALIAVALECGLRRRELATVTAANVDLENQTVKVFGKRRKWRRVPFGDTCKKLIVRHLAWRELVDPTAETLFIDPKGNELTGPKLQTRLGTVRKHTTIPRLHWHLFRVTYANRFLAAGGDSFLLRENMGHTSFRAVASYIRAVGVSNFALSRKASLLDAGKESFLLTRLIGPL